MQVQTRSETNGIRYFQQLSDAMIAAEKDSSIFNISFSFGMEPVRLVRFGDQWVYQPLTAQKPIFASLPSE